MKKKLSLSKRIGPWQIILGLIAAALVAFYLYGALGASSVVLDVSSASKKVVVGAPFDITASIKNISRGALTNAKLSLSLPGGLVFADVPGLKIRTIDLGEIGPNGNHEESFRIVAIPIPAANILEPVAALSYSRGSIKGSFTENEKIHIEIADLGLSLELIGPEKVISGEPFDLKAVYARSNIYASETENIPALKIRFDYPSALSVNYLPPQTADDMPPTKPLDRIDAKTFSLGILKPGDNGEIDMRNNIDLPEGSSFKLTASILVNIMGDDYVLVSKDFTATLSPSPLSVMLWASANSVPTAESPKAVFNAGDTINYLVTYKNQTDLPFDNVVLKIKLTGAMYDINSVSAGSGLWNPSTRTISWDSSSFPEFKSLAAGATGSLTFTIKLASAYPIRRLNDKNFRVLAEARIESPTLQKDIEASKTESSFALENKISGQIKVEAKGFFRDAPALILNDGPWPPRVNQPTDFTIHWILTNYSTDLTNIEVRGELPDGYIFTGAVKSNISSAPQFNASTGEVSWKLDKLYATAGITSDSPEAIFQVRATPVTAGDYAPILGATTVTATDTFTGLQITAIDEGITSRLPDDLSIKENEGKVVN